MRQKRFRADQPAVRSLALAMLACLLPFWTACGSDDESGDTADSGTMVVDAGVPDSGLGDAAPPPRYFASVPYVLDYPDAVIKAEHIAEDSNMLALYFAFYGVPWQAFIDGTPPPADWVSGLDESVALATSLDQPVFLALTPLGAGYKVLMEDSATGVSPSGSPCEDFSARADWADLTKAYGDYVDFLVTRTNPRFLALSIELSGYFLDENNRLVPECVDNWPDLRQMFNDIYDAQKLKHPELQIFHTFQIDAMWNAKNGGDCVGYLESCVTENINVLGDLKMDLFGMSIYPLWSYVEHGGMLADNYLSIFQEKTGLPLAVAETGWQHLPITIDDPVQADACVEILFSSESLQLMWMNRVLSEAESMNMPLVTWWSDHDVLPQSVASNCRCSGSNWCPLLDSSPIADVTMRFFGSMGLRDYDGNPRPALEPWKAAQQ